MEFAAVEKEWMKFGKAESFPSENTPDHQFVGFGMDEPLQPPRSSQSLQQSISAKKLPLSIVMAKLTNFEV